MYNISFFDKVLNRVKDAYIHGLLMQTFERYIPNYFWTASASTTGKYHPELCNGVGGLCVHTLLVSCFSLKFADSLNLDQSEIDIILAAALLHDIYKFGTQHESQWNYPFYYEHGKLTADILWRRYGKVFDSGRNENYIKLKRICDAIYFHNGLYERFMSVPEGTINQILHFADLAAAFRIQTLKDAETFLETFVSTDHSIMASGEKFTVDKYYKPKDTLEISLG